MHKFLQDIEHGIGELPVELSDIPTTVDDKDAWIADWGSRREYLVDFYREIFNAFGEIPKY